MCPAACARAPASGGAKTFLWQAQLWQSCDASGTAAVRFLRLSGTRQGDAHPLPPPGKQLMSTRSLHSGRCLNTDPMCVDTKDKQAAFNAFHWSMPTAQRVKPRYSKCKSATSPYFVRLVSKWSTVAEFCVDIPGVCGGGGVRGEHIGRPAAASSGQQQPHSSDQQ